jgi:spore coat polysaccharide biosynthesis protein SpsF
VVVNTVENPSAGTNHTVAIIQARLSASRLPGKVLLDIAGEPMLTRVFERTRRSQLIDEVVVATSEDKSDDRIEDFCVQRAYPYFRGSLHDVLDRYYQAAVQFSADIVVRITADCPIIDPTLIDQTILAFYGRGPSVLSRDDAVPIDRKQLVGGNSPAWDFTANRLPPPWKRTFPIGLDTEVCTFTALKFAWQLAKEPHQREHVMPFLYEKNQPFLFLVLNHEPDFGDIRLTVDTPQDLELLNLVYKKLGNKIDFSWYEVLDLLEKEPELVQINAGVRHKDFRDFEQSN